VGGPTFNGVNIFDLALPSSGIVYALELRDRYAAQWAGYIYYTEFVHLPAQEQNSIVASYLIDAQLKGLLEQEQVRRMKRKVSNA